MHASAPVDASDRDVPANFAMGVNTLLSLKIGLCILLRILLSRVFELPSLSRRTDIPPRYHQESVHFRKRRKSWKHVLA